MDQFDGVVTELPTNMFKSCKQLKTVVLPKTVRVIGESAFNGCTAMKNIALPETVTSIGANAFYN